MSAYYNEFDLYAAAWLRKLIKAKLIADGEVDERSITDVKAEDLRGFAQCHFFAGIGGWSYALRLAGWPDARPVWTGSCPCQPFSLARTQVGTDRGSDDSRDLWPTWFRHIEERRPDIVLGEQVEAAIGYGWIDRLFDDMERMDYACGAIGLPACSVNAQHIRQRLFWVADSGGEGRSRHRQDSTLSVATSQIESVNGDAFGEARRALDGDYNHLLLSNGLSVGVEQRAIKCYGNAIVPQVAAEFIRGVLR